MPKLIKKRGKVSYRVNLTQIKKIQRADIATSEQQSAEMVMQKKVSTLQLRGLSFDEIAEELEISTNEAFRIAKEVMVKWGSKDLNLNAAEMVEVEKRRLDAMTAAISARAFPHPIISGETGLPLLDANGEPIMTKADLPAMNMLLQIMDRRAKLCGLDAAEKREQLKTAMLVRQYIGANPDEL